VTVWADLATVEVAVLLNGAWVDISSPYVLTRGSSMTWSEGRQSELGDDEPASGHLTLLNNDHRFTVGNTTSALYPYWAQARQIRIRENVGGETFETFAYLEVPEDTRTEHANSDRVTANLVDLLGRMQSMPTFVSTLGAHIVHNGGDVLKGYWPSNEAGVSFRDVIGSHPPIAEVYGQSSSGFVPDSGGKAVAGQGASSISGDDVSLARLDASLGTFASQSVIAAAPDMRIGFFFEPLAVGETVTFIGWYYPQLAQYTPATYLLGFNATEVASLQLAVGVGGELTVTATGNLTGTIDGPVLPDQAWTPIALRYGFDPSVFELWVGTHQYTGALSGSTPASDTVLSATVGTFYAGGFGHIQLYVGASSEWTFTDYLAQHQHALVGLERQTTGQRVNTVLDYAGVDSASRDVDRGCSVMQRAALAGRTPLAALQEANTTEQGRLFMRANRIQFHDRRRVYNI
jgi:hypothetical protein